AMEGQVHFWVVGIGNVIGGTLVAVYWDELGTSLALPYPKIDLLESMGPGTGLLFSFAGLALAMWLVHLNARRFQPKRSAARSEEHTSELQSRENLVCRLLLEKKNIIRCNTLPM